MKSVLNEFIKFCIIGGIAAITHFLMLMLLFHQYKIQLALANFIAFLIAFWVSYFGHRIFTFDAVNIQHIKTLPKFIFVAGLGFIFNEITLLTTHYIFPLINISILAIFVIVFTAFITFCFNKFFAFKHGSS